MEPDQTVPLGASMFASMVNVLLWSAFKICSMRYNKGSKHSSRECRIMKFCFPNLLAEFYNNSQEVNLFIVD